MQDIRGSLMDVLLRCDIWEGDILRKKLNCVSIHFTTCAMDKAFIAPVVVHRRTYVPAIKTMDTVCLSIFVVHYNLCARRCQGCSVEVELPKDSCMCREGGVTAG